MTTRFFKARTSRSALAATTALLLATACFVPQNRYDEAVTKLHTEQAAHADAEARIAETRAELTRIDEALRAREQSLTAKEDDLAASKLDVERVSTERDDAAALVEQLRGELGRVGENLHEYSDQKRELESALTEAEARAKRVDALAAASDEKMAVMRDLTLSLGESLANGKVLLTATDGKPTVRFDAHEAYGDNGQLSPESSATLKRVGAVLAHHAGALASLAERSTNPSGPDDRADHLRQVALALAQAGVHADRVALVPAPLSSSDAQRGENDGASSAAAATSPVASAASSGPTSDSAATPSDEGSWLDGPGSVEIVIDVKPSDTSRVAATD
ncbi:MAG TPA: hypothetical protein VH142_15280 [Polyangiaceae bacterium]|jgi:hypothetical protein|nr:hypothetical protein [Polyangiaceae bacterium]